MGIEPTYPAWKAGVLPMNYTRTCDFKSIAKTKWFVNTFLEKSADKPHFFNVSLWNLPFYLSLIQV